MLGQLAKSLGELSLKSTQKSLISQNSMKALTAPKATPLLNKSMQSLCTASTQKFLLPASITTVISKRTYFSSMDEIGRGECAKDAYGITLYDKDGKRTTLKGVENRFKRLDWGMWLRVRGGRDKKHWKKSMRQLRECEMHYFCRPYHNRRFDLAVASEIKEMRHIPDDPYRVYNDISYQNHYAIRHKNSVRIRKYGNNIYNWSVFQAHYKKQIRKVDKTKRGRYEPPKYQKAIADGDGVYTPDLSIPYDTPAPHYQLEQRMQSLVTLKEEQKFRRFIKRHEKYVGYLSQTSPLKLPVHGTLTG
eukprot:TRINITY_DN3554_c0_g1_i4.p1 TRINITY_DN3554_c0_g1~~TRINITY_DN3554_c0_g1_i4.p1  ORF type:complete len:304 (-),score=33.31 TRINITY_DN3554_c0_g1_i4:55-966(-)